MFEIHLTEVKEVLFRKMIINLDYELISSLESFSKDLRLSSEIEKIKDVVAGYYISDNIFYYLIKHKTKYFLGKHFFVKDIEIEIDEEHLQHIESLDFITFKTFCRIMDHKIREYDKENKLNE